MELSGAAGEIATGLADRFAARQRDQLVDEHRHALVENPEGQSFLHEALREIVLAGLRDRLRALGGKPSSARLPSVLRLEQACLDVRAQYELLERPSPVTPPTSQRAEQLAVDAGQALGLTGNPGRARSWRKAGRDAALAGAVIAEVLADSSSDPETPLAPSYPSSSSSLRAGTPESDVHWEEQALVSVAVAANLAEAELLQARLRQAGIPSVEVRTGANTALLLQGGYREVCVPAEAVELAQELLAPVPDPGIAGDDGGRTRKIGLERSSLRRAGKAAIWFNLAPLGLLPLLVGFVVAAGWGLAGGLAVLALELVLLGALVLNRRS